MRRITEIEPCYTAAVEAMEHDLTAHLALFQSTAEVTVEQTRRDLEFKITSTDGEQTIWASVTVPLYYAKGNTDLQARRLYSLAELLLKQWTTRILERSP